MHREDKQLVGEELHEQTEDFGDESQQKSTFGALSSPQLLPEVALYQSEPQALFAEELTLEAQIEALLFASPQPLKALDILEILQIEELSLKQIGEICESLLRFYNEKGGGFKLAYLPEQGYQFRTVAAASYLMERMFSQKPRPLSRAAHETLAIIAYRQPVTRADIEFIRGVDAGSIIKNLLERNLIQCTGRKEDSPGRPMLFGTTEEFLTVYRLTSLKDLPPLESFQPSQDTLEKALARLDAQLADKPEELILPKGHDKEEATTPSL